MVMGMDMDMDTDLVTDTVGFIIESVQFTLYALHRHFVESFLVDPVLKFFFNFVQLLIFTLFTHNV